MSGVAGRLAKADYWVLNLNGLMYSLDSGFLAHLHESIAGGFNQLTHKDKHRKALLAGFTANLARNGQHVANPAALKPNEAVTALPAIVQTVSQLLPEQLPATLDRLYSSDYSPIKPDSELVSAFKIAREKGVEIFFYTGGPSGKQPGETRHVQRVMQAVGFDAETIEYMRPRTYDLLDAVAAGHGRTTRESMRSFIDFSHIRPSRAMIASASMKNLEMGGKVGMEALWIRTTEGKETSHDLSRARVLGAALAKHSGNALHRIALTR